MPLYEYRCKSCHQHFERIRKFSDPPITICPNCGKETVDQVISAPAVQFKGSGWYVTDYAHKHSSQGSAGPASNGESSSSASKTETKPEAKSAPVPTSTH